MSFLGKIFGIKDANLKVVAKIQPWVDEINKLEPEFQALTDEALKNKTNEFKARFIEQSPLDALRSQTTESAELARGDINEKLEQIGNPDIVFAPVGGLKSELLDAEAAMKLINKMEPKIAIPMLYDIKELKTKRAPLSLFLKESEAKDAPVPKLIIKKKDLIEEETKIVILEKV